jgi:hypothetical protein
MIDYHEISSAEDINYRKSGSLFAGIIALIYALLLIRGKHQPYLLIVSAVIAVLACFEAWPLRKAVDLLIRVGNIMHRFTNPLVFSLIYVFAIIPTALVLKILGKDVLSLRYDSNRPTYWEARSAVDSWKDSFRNQF